MYVPTCGVLGKFSNWMIKRKIGRMLLESVHNVPVTTLRRKPVTQYLWLILRQTKWVALGLKMKLSSRISHEIWITAVLSPPELQHRCVCIFKAKNSKSAFIKRGALMKKTQFCRNLTNGVERSSLKYFSNHYLWSYFDNFKFYGKLRNRSKELNRWVYF